MKTTEQNPTLPAYRVTYEDGTSYVTSMAAGITLAQAREYFVDHEFEQPNGSKKKVKSVSRAEPIALEQTNPVGQKPDHFIGSAHLGTYPEGKPADYAKLNGQWFSVNGSANEITDVRWSIHQNSPLHRELDRIAGLVTTDWVQVLRAAATNGGQRRLTETMIERATAIALRNNPNFPLAITQASRVLLAELGN